jgi:hypothetical protein
MSVVMLPMSSVSASTPSRLSNSDRSVDSRQLH